MEDFNQTLQNLEDALSNGTINEGQYLELMNMAKKRWEEQNKNDDDDDEEVEVETIDRYGDVEFLQSIEIGMWIVIDLEDDTNHKTLFESNNEEQAYLFWDLFKYMKTQKIYWRGRLVM